MAAVRWNDSHRVIAAPGFIEPALPTVAPTPPAGGLWVHEIKHDGYRLMVRRSRDRVRICLFVFDLLEVDGADIRRLPLWERKQRLMKLIGRKPAGILYNEHIEDDGETVFRHACLIGCEGIVSKRLDLPYRSGRVKSWIKIKNPKAPAMLRIEEGTF